MSLPGTFTYAALSADKPILAFDPVVAQKIDEFLSNWQQGLKDPFEMVIGDKYASYVIWFITALVENWIRYIPDKTISAMIAVVVVRYCLPLFQKELIVKEETGQLHQTAAGLFGRTIDFVKGTPNDTPDLEHRPRR